MNLLNSKKIAYAAYFIIIVSIISSFFLIFQRSEIEKENNKVEIMVNFTELKALANGSGMSTEQMAVLLKEKGVTDVLVKELCLGDLVRTGQISFYLDGEVKLSPYYQDLSSDIPESDANVILLIHNAEIEKQIVSHLETKVTGTEYYQGDVPTVVIPVNIPNSDSEKETLYKDLKSIGVGLDNNSLKEIENSGLKIVPQYRYWEKPTAESLQFLAENIKSTPNISFIMFNDENLPGYPDKLGILAEHLKDNNDSSSVPIGIIEFFNQKGITNLAINLEKNVVRVHSISLNEMKNYNTQKAIERFELAVKERNIRAIFVRFFDMSLPASALDTNMDYLEQIEDSLTSQGFETGTVKDISSPFYSRILVAIIGLGVIAGGALIIAIKGWEKQAVLLNFLGIVLWGVLLFKNPLLGRKLMALASVVVFPTLAFLSEVKNEGRSLINSILAFIKISIISWLGAVLMMGLLADKLFMLKLDQFIGVKAAHILPLLMIPLLLLVINNNYKNKIRTLLEGFITYKAALLAAIAFAALAFYIIRTGNVGTSLVTGLEQQMRESLQEFLGVRPRTKEFLIGHPFALFMLYFGLKEKNWWILLPAIIGQVSLVNTYAHIHTPLIISLIRSFHGLWIGIIIGIAFIYAWKMVERYLRDN